MPWHTVLEFLLHTTTKIGAVFMENNATNPDVLERFLRYVQINTQSEDANCDQVPSSNVQFDLANILAKELRELGAADAHVTEHAYVCAHIPASAGAEDKPALGLIAHLDTTEVAPGAGVKPHIVHYEGGDLVCGTVDGKPVAMSTAKLPALNDLVGEDLVCSDGTTLLGADDKAGVAEIMALVARLLQSVPLVIALVVLAIVVYVFVAWVKSPLRAKEILIKLFTVITIVLSVAFGLASLYAFFEHNVKVLEITGTFLVVSLVALGITRICRWRFVKRHPQYKNKAMPTKYL